MVRVPPVPPLCQVITRPSTSLVCQASPIRPLLGSARGSRADIPGAVPASTAWA